MSEQEKVTRAEVDDMWNRFQDEVVAHAHDYTRRNQLIEERLSELSSMIEHCDDITGDRQDLVSQLDDHVRQLGLEATPTKLPLLYFEEKLQSPQTLSYGELDEGETRGRFPGTPVIVPKWPSQPNDIENGPDYKPPQRFIGWLILAVVLLVGILLLLHFVLHLF